MSCECDVMRCELRCHCHESRLEIPCNPFNTHSHPLGSADTPILCEDNNCYPNSDSPCEDITSSCSGTRVRCSDGSCRVSSSVCPEQTCPLHLPVRCEDGKCVSDESECVPSCENSYLCRKPSRLGELYPEYEIKCCDNLSHEECCLYPQNADACSEQEERCQDGVCRTKGQCVNGVNCPKEYPYRCVNEECVRDPSQCMANPVCRDGWVDCGNGLCAPSYGDCKLFLTRRNICEGDKPVMCADGTCASTLGMVSRRSVA